METLSAALRDDADRAVRIGRVKFVALALNEAACVAQAPAVAEASFHRFLRLIRRLASRVDGRPSAARP